MLSRLELSKILDRAAGGNKHARLSLLDEYDHRRRSHGIAFAVEHLQSRVKVTSARLRLESAADKLQDPAAQAAIRRAMSDDAQTLRAADLLTGEQIQAALRAQSVTEDSIRRLAARSDKPLTARRWLRKQAKQGAAAVNLALGLVGGGGNEHKHCTPFEQSLRDQQKTRWRTFAERTKLYREGQELPMLTILSEANRKRVSEVYTLSKGLEKHARDAGLTWAFITLTAPPNMHPNPSHGKSTWDGTLPDHAHNWIHSAWRKVEARFRKAGILVSGVRVCEPHKDGCPHWHLMLFVHPSQMGELETIMRTQRGCEHWKAEAGLKFMLDDGRATAASYLFKYVLKTVNSIETLTGEAASVDSWRSTWGIRAFQWIGMPPISLWRNLRATKNFQSDDPRMMGLWLAARRGDGAAFIGLAGGLNIKRAARPIKTRITTDLQHKSIDFISCETGEQVRIVQKKWEVGQREVAVIPNYPRTSNHPLLPRPLRGRALPIKGRDLPFGQGTGSGTRPPTALGYTHRYAAGPARASVGRTTAAPACGLRSRRSAFVRIGRLIPNLQGVG